MGTITTAGGILYHLDSPNPRFIELFGGELAAPDELLFQFRKNHKPKLEINFSSLYSEPGQFQVLSPVLVPTADSDASASMMCTSPKSNSVLDENAKESCEQFLPTGRDDRQPPVLFDAPATRAGSKWKLFSEFLSGHLDLPRNFLLTPPFLAPNGESYAQLLQTKGGPYYNSKTWIESNLSFYKPDELRAIDNLFNVSRPEFVTISHLTAAELEQVILGRSTILTSLALLIRNETSYGFSPLSYWVFDRNLFTQFLSKQSSYAVSEVETPWCLEKTGNICWSYSKEHFWGSFQRYYLIIVILISGMLVAFFGLILRYFYDRERARRNQQLALQILSHEFRTPVSTLLLLLESRSQWRVEDKTNEQALADQEDLWIGLSSEAFKLQRILEVSSRYLQAVGRDLHFKSVEISSLNEWLDDWLQQEKIPLNKESLIVDGPLIYDPFWLHFILSNLLQNAVNHGAPPLTLRLQQDKKNYHIEIEDAGFCAFDSLSEMIDPFTKSQCSRGMGLGLSMINEVLRQSGGRLSFWSSPTRFRVTLPRK